MNQCSHYWIIDKDGNAKCRYCSATTYFPPEKIEFDRLERTLVEGYNPPAFWQTGSLHESLERVEGG